MRAAYFDLEAPKSRNSTPLTPNLVTGISGAWPVEKRARYSAASRSAASGYVSGHLRSPLILNSLPWGRALRRPAESRFVRYKMRGLKFAVFPPAGATAEMLAHLGRVLDAPSDSPGRERHGPRVATKGADAAGPNPFEVYSLGG
jgi:hypothetical protein